MLNEKLNLNPDVFMESSELKSEREGFGEAVMDLGQKEERVIVLCADLTESLKLNAFSKKFPTRFIEVGIAEQNMAGIAAGLALSGKIPFIASHAVFSPYRNWDQIRLSVALTKANVKIVSSHVGFSNSPDGSVAESLEDIALMRVLPNMVVISPIDYEQTKKAVVKALYEDGPVYIRICKEKTPQITTSKTPFEIGEAYKLTEGEDITIVSTGAIIYEALNAAKKLKALHKISAEVIATPTIKPLDEATIIGSVKKTGKCVTLEEHQINGGLGSAVAEILAKENLPLNARIGVNDSFGGSGSYEELKNKFGLSSHHIVKLVKELL